MIPESGLRFSDKIMLEEPACARKMGTGFPKKIMLPQWVSRKPIRPIVISLIISLSCEVCRILAATSSGQGKEANNAGLQARR
jgi:hypothetical protein